MTDGVASDGDDPRVPTIISEADDNFDVMFGVGVGADFNMDLLLDISRGGEVFSVADFKALNDIVSDIVDETCETISNGR